MIKASPGVHQWIMRGFTLPLWNVPKACVCEHLTLQMTRANQIRSIYTTEQINYCLTISRFVTSPTQTRCWKQRVKNTVL